MINMNVGWTEKLLGRIMAYDKSQILNLICGYLNVSPMLKLGPNASDKLVVRHAFDFRRQQIRPRFAAVKSAESARACVDEVGQVLFGSMGIFSLVLREQKAVQVKHVPTGAVATITSDNIDARWYLDKNFSETRACVQMDGSRTDKHCLHDYFGKHEGPHSEPQLVGKSPVWGKLMTDASAIVLRNREQATDGIVPKANDIELAEATKARQQESAKRARERMCEKQAERSKRARLTIAA